jgi:hypothetical protein
LKWILRICVAVSFFLVVTVTSVFVIQNTADGPIGPIPGASFSSGTEVTGLVNLSEIVDFDDEIEFELLSKKTSRTTGAFTYQDELYIPCDLGFIWNRFPTGVARTMLNVIYLFKDWHEFAALDGRALIRKGGYIYRRHLTKVIDPVLIDALRATILEGLETVELPVEKLGPIPTEGPRDIWFFRVDMPT